MNAAATIERGYDLMANRFYNNNGSNVAYLQATMTVDYIPGTFDDVVTHIADTYGTTLADLIDDANDTDNGETAVQFATEVNAGADYTAADLTADFNVPALNLEWVALDEDFTPLFAFTH